MEALRPRLTPEIRSELERRFGVSQATVSNIVNAKQTLEPMQVFEIESVLGLPPGALSHHLGYVPVGASSVISAIEDDPALTPIHRKALETLYLTLVSEDDS